MGSRLAGLDGPTKRAEILAIVLYFGGTNRLYWTCWTKKRHRYTHPQSTKSLIGLKDNDSIGEAVLAAAGNKRPKIDGKHFI